MKYNLSTTIEAPVNGDSLSSIIKVLESEFKTIAKNISTRKNILKVRQIKSSSFNKGNRKDTTSITIVPNENKNGYLIEVETTYRKTVSFYFWDYLCLALGIVLCFVTHAIPWLLLFFIGWHCLCRFTEYYIFNKDVSNMKNIIHSSLEKAKHIIENGNKVRTS